MKTPLLLVALSLVALAPAQATAKGRTLKLRSVSTGCTATITHDRYGDMRLLVKDKNGREIADKHSSIEEDQAVLNQDGYQVHANYRNDRDVVWASWSGGGFDGLPQDYALVRRQGDRYVAQKEMAFFRGTQVYCADMVAR